MLQRLKTYLNYFLIAAGLFFSFLMLRIVWPYFSFRYDVDFLLSKQSVLHIGIWRIAFYTHISSSLVVLLFGLLQFIKPVLNQAPRIHRLLGKAYVFLVVGISAPSGLIMAIYANGGIAAQVSFIIVSALWWFYTLMAYKKAISKEFKAHTDYMIRSYALTLSAISLRIYVLLLPSLILLHGKEMYVLVSWLSWVPNLLIAELIIKSRFASPYLSI